MTFVRERALPDLEKRFYIARDKQDLEKYMKLYARGELKSKFSPELVDKYAFPMDTGSPYERISDYIQAKISGQ